MKTRKDKCGYQVGFPKPGYSLLRSGSTLCLWFCSGSKSSWNHIETAYFSRFQRWKGRKKIGIQWKRFSCETSSSKKVNPYKACIYGLCRDFLDGDGYDLGTFFNLDIMNSLFYLLVVFFTRKFVVSNAVLPERSISVSL